MTHEPANDSKTRAPGRQANACAAETERIDQLEALNHAYMEMLSFVSHELSSPLVSMVSLGRTLIAGFHGELLPAQRERVERMVTRAEHLLQLARDYLNLAAIETGELQIHIQKNVDLRDQVIDPAVETVRPQMVDQRIAYTQQLEGDLKRCECDPSLMEIVLVNLLGNAVKYGNRAGQIELTAERVGDRLRLSVFNEGIGFPLNERSKLFRRFYRVPTPHRRVSRSTGVGLYVCRQIVERHRGRIQAESEEGRWARFGLEIPQPIPAEISAG